MARQRFDCYVNASWARKFGLFLAAALALGLCAVTPERSDALSIATGPLQEYLFDVGKKHYDAGKVGEAAASWRNVLPDPLYGPVAYLLLARGFRREGDLAGAESQLKDFLKAHSNTVYQGVARSELVEILARQKKPEALPMLSSMLSKALETDKPALLFETAQLERRLGKFEEAAGHYRTLFLTYPASVEGLKAGEDLAWMVVHGQIPRPEFSDMEQKERARRLFDKGRFDLAAEAYKALLDKDRSDTGLMVKLGKSLFKDRQNYKALAVLKEAVKAQGQLKHRIEALHLLSLLYWRLDRPREFEMASKELLEKGPPDLKRKVLYNMGAHDYEKAKFVEARAGFNRYLKNGPDASGKADAKWKLAWIEYRTANYKGAAATFREARSISPGGRLTRAASYWEARSLLQLKRSGEAAVLLRQIVQADPLGYYGIEAGRLLKSQGMLPEEGNSNKKSFPRTDLTLEENADKRIASASKLMEKRLYEFALLNLKDLPNGLKSAPAVTFLTARAAYGAHRYKEARDILASGFSALMANPPADAPPEFVEIAFPRVHPTLTMGAARKHGIDPDLVWAVIRQESLYDPEAVSPAGALGLMQVTPAAAGVASKKSKTNSKAISEILEPSRNLAAGINILAKNLATFKGNVVPAVAAYNADINKVRAWLRKNGKMSQDEFIENIPYLETRIYVKKVLAGYQAYSRLHKKKDLAGFW